MFRNTLNYIISSRTARTLRTLVLLPVALATLPCMLAVAEPQCTALRPRYMTVSESAPSSRPPLTNLSIY